MATKILDSESISVFCQNVAVMYSAGIQLDESISLLRENTSSKGLQDACDSIYKSLLRGTSLTTAVSESGCFPDYAVSMISAGEHSGRLENVLWNLSNYYSEESRLFDKIRNAIGYPAALLTIMSIILVFVVFVILPVFIDVYENFAGGVGGGSFAFIGASIVIGNVALVATLICTIAVLAALLTAQSASGQRALMNFLSKMPGTRKPLREMAIGRFTAALSTCLAAGIDSETAFDRAYEMVDNQALKTQLAKARDLLVDPSGSMNIATAIVETEVLSPMYSQMLVVGSKSGSVETVIATISAQYFENAVTSLDGLIDSFEPALAAFLTIAVGCTLAAVMIPLIGIMNSIG